MLVPYNGDIAYLLWESWGHGVGHHWWWGWWLLGLWWRWLRVEREWRVVHAILSCPLHGPKLGRALEALMTKSTHLICRSTEITLSIAFVIIVVTIATARVTTIAAIVSAVLGLTAAKGILWTTAKPSIAVPVPVTTTTKVIAPTTPRIPIPTVILVATSSPPSATCKKGKKKEGQNKGEGPENYNTDSTKNKTLILRNTEKTMIIRISMLNTNPQEDLISTSKT